MWIQLNNDYAESSATTIASLVFTGASTVAYNKVMAPKQNGESLLLRGTSVYSGEKPSAVSQNTADFEMLVEQWQTDTMFSSSLDEMVEHPAYQQIIQMGTSVVSLILDKLQEEPDYWFHALTEITGDDPISPKDYGDMDKMAMKWINWGKKHGYLN